MLIRFTTKNVDGLKIEWCFNSVEAVLKDWWANDAEKLHSGDAPVYIGKDYCLGSRFCYEVTPGEHVEKI